MPSLDAAGGSYPLAEHLADTVLSLPIGSHMPETAVDTVATAVREALGG